MSSISFSASSSKSLIASSFFNCSLEMLFSAIDKPNPSPANAPVAILIPGERYLAATKPPDKNPANKP